MFKLKLNLLKIFRRLENRLLMVFIMAFVFSISISYSEEPSQNKQIGFDEKLNQMIPLNLSFLNEYGQPVKLQELFGKPTLFMLVYYRCTGLCSPLMNGVAQVVDVLDMEAGKDYNIVTISFDPKETYLMASEKKKNYFDEIKKKIPDNSWHFLTGDSASIAKITDAAGFRYIKQGNDYIHSTALIAVSPDGKIARYLYGTEFNPFDVKLSLVEASEGRSGPSIIKLVKLCYSYDPEGKRYVLNITRIAGGGIVILLIAFVSFLTLKNRSKNRKSINNNKKMTDINIERNSSNG